MCSFNFSLLVIILHVLHVLNLNWCTPNTCVLRLLFWLNLASQYGHWCSFCFVSEVGLSTSVLGAVVVTASSSSWYPEGRAAFLGVEIWGSLKRLFCSMKSARFSSCGSKVWSVV